jgi:hypothetical protein
MARNVIVVLPVTGGCCPEWSFSLMARSRAGASPRISQKAIRSGRKKRKYDGLDASGQLFEKILIYLRVTLNRCNPFR